MRGGRGKRLRKSRLMTIDDVLHFWFSELTPDQWFRGGEAVDKTVEARFGSLLEQVASGQHDDWATTPNGRLALVLVLDQFPRNVHRGQAKSFSYDGKALALVLEGLSQRLDERLTPIQRTFFYLPMEHSEVLEIQDRSVERYASLVLAVPATERAEYRNYLDYAWRHYEIIKRFGRYPHRNAILGRAPTEEEEEFLRQPGSSF